MMKLDPHIINLIQSNAIVLFAADKSHSCLLDEFYYENIQLFIVPERFCFVG